MVAILEMGEFNSDFHPMVDFIEASPLRRNLKLRDKDGIVSIPDTELFENLTLMGPSFSGKIVPLFDTMLVHQGKGSGTPTEPHHTPFPEADTSHPTTLSIPLPSIPTALIPLVTQPNPTPIKQYSRRARIAQSYALPTVTDEHASPMRDVSEGEACPTDSGFIADQDRATIAKSSTLPHDSTPRVTSPTADEGSSRGGRLKERVQVLEDREGDAAKQSRDDASIKGRSINKREAAAERISNDSEEIARGKEVMVESDTLKKKRLQEQINAQVARELEEQQEKEDMRMNEQIAKDTEVARIHAEEELQGMIDSLDKSNETIAKYLQEYQDFASELPLEKRIELISDLVKYQDNYSKVKDFIPMGSKEETERLKRKGLNLDQEQVKKQKSSKEAPKIETSTKEFTEEKMKEMMQLVPIEDVYIQALQLKHPIIDWKQLDREDLNQLLALVKEYLSIRLATSEKEMELWVELKRMYEPDPKDQLWTLTQNFMHAPVEWKLYDLSGVHHLTAKDKEIFMLVEKDYPLRKGLALVMISYKLQVENYSQMAEDLIRKIYNIANSPRQQDPQRYYSAISLLFLTLLLLEITLSNNNLEDPDLSFQQYSLYACVLVLLLSAAIMPSTLDPSTLTYDTISLEIKLGKAWLNYTPESGIGDGDVEMRMMVVGGGWDDDMMMDIRWWCRSYGGGGGFGGGDVEGKGKAIATKEQAAHSLLALHTPKRRSTTDQFIRQRQDNSGGDTEVLQIDEDQGKDVNNQVNLEKNTTELDQGQARSDPGKTLESRPQLEQEFIKEDQAGPEPEVSHVALAGPNPEPTHEKFMANVYPDVHGSLKLPTDEHVIIEEPLSSSGTLSSMKNLDDAYTFRDQFLNDKSTEDEPGKLNMDSKVVSMVIVPIHQASSSVPLISTPIMDLPPPKRVSSTTKAPIFTATTTATTTTLPLLLPPPLTKQSTSDSELVPRMFESGSYKSLPEHVALYEALEVSMKWENRDEFFAKKDKSHKRHRDNQDPPPPLSDLDPSKKRRHDSDASGLTQPPAPQSLAWKTSDTQETPSSSFRKHSYQDPDEYKLLRQTGDMSSFINWFCKRIGKKKLSKTDLEGPTFKVTIQLQYFFNKDLEYLVSGDKGRRSTLSISKLKAAHYLDFGLKELVSTLWVESEREYDINAAYGIFHWWILEKLDHMVKDFRLFKYNPDMTTRIWSEDDRRRSKEFMEVIEYRLKL
nr:hypothetical protein [Tanacetum cinerariifolium]